MRTDLLTGKTATTVLDSNGNGTARLQVQVNQWWRLQYVKVSTVSQKPPFPRCTVYAGPAAVAAYYVDDTAQGQSDSSSMIGSFVLQFGDFIFAVWTNGNAGDTGILQVWGEVTSG